MTEIGVVADEYFQQLQDLVHSCGNFIDRLPQRLSNAKDTVLDAKGIATRWLTDFWRDFSDNVFDISPMGTSYEAYKVIMEIYLWVSLCIMVASFGYFLGSTLLASMLASIFNTNYAVLISFVLYPNHGFYTLRKLGMGLESRALFVLHYAFFGSMMMGYALRNYQLDFMPPPAFVHPLVIALLTIYVGPLMGHFSRLALFAVVFTSSTLVYVFLESSTRNASATYNIWAAILTLVAVVDLQM
uniref:Protein YIP n=1 Tax=Romanomermis culicivorax TaxID=13658 RepID=A0A915ICT4_ROMCU